MPENRRKRQRRIKTLRKIEKQKKVEKATEILLRSSFGVEWEKYRRASMR